MREIKFRYFDKLKEKIEDFRGMPMLIEELESIREREDMPVMQYTGLKDKNGIEIYEGDILEADASGTMLGDTFFTGFQRYQRRKFVQDIRKLDFWNYTDKIEVIGNIYEHPHLLEEK